MLDKDCVISLVVLVVEDEGPVRRAVVSFLRDEGCIVMEAISGEQALGFLDRADSIDVVFTDIRLGGPLNGWDVGEAFHAIRPEMLVVYGSGNPIEPVRPVPGSLVFYKPYNVDGLMDAFSRFRQRGGNAAGFDRRD